MQKYKYFLLYHICGQPDYVNKNIHIVFLIHSVENYVDDVDILFSKQIFAYFYYISGAHSYQQIAVDTIFQNKFFDLIERSQIVSFCAQRLDSFSNIPRTDSQRIRFPGRVNIRQDHFIRCRTTPLKPKRCP